MTFLKYFLSLGPKLPQSYRSDSHEIVSNGKYVHYVNTWDKIILRLDCPTDLASCKWTELQQKLRLPREESLAFLIPDELTECT